MHIFPYRQEWFSARQCAHAGGGSYQIPLCVEIRPGMYLGWDKDGGEDGGEDGGWDGGWDGGE